jgi:hypothetical protein
MSDIKQVIKQLASTFSADVTAIRRHLHTNPDSPFKIPTSAFVNRN